MDSEYGPSPHQVVREQVDDYEQAGGVGVLSYRNRLPIVVVTTLGARTGLVRKTPLMRVERDGRYLAVASMGGADRNPQWLHNVRANDEVLLQDGPEVRSMRARELTGAERDAWWAYAVEVYPLYADYQLRTGRLIPLLLLDPADPWTVLDGYDGLAAAVGTDLGTSPWRTVEQGAIDGFADVTGDHAWIHVDRERAAAGPYGGTIAHGLLTLSLVTRLVSDVVRIGGLTFALHYGYDRVRFISPVPAGSRIAAAVRLTSLDGDRARVKASYRVEVLVEEQDRPACVADLIYLYSF